MMQRHNVCGKKSIYLFDSSSSVATGGLSLSLCGENCGDGERCPSMALWEEAGGEEAG